MRRLLGLALLLAACGPQTTATAPAWIRRPDADAMTRYYPEAALEQKVVGRVVLDCEVALDTTASCVVKEESPEGWDFGQAALALSQSFRLQPGQLGGQPVAGTRKSVTLRFVVAARTDTEMTAEERTFRERVPQPDLPHWDAAPTAYEVAAAFPEAAVGRVERARAVLQCRVNQDRTLACEPLLDTPAGSGFSEAAMRLSRRFRVAEVSADFAAAHATDTFILPVNFGAPEVQEPLSTVFSGVGPITWEPAPPHIMRELYPLEAIAAGVEGRALILCTLTDTGASCSLESENPTGWGFGARARTHARGMGLAPENTGMLPGDQIRLPFEYRLR